MNSKILLDGDDGKNQKPAFIVGRYKWFVGQVGPGATRTAHDSKSKVAMAHLIRGLL
jgi:hypothetical protein